MLKLYHGFAFGVLLIGLPDETPYPKFQGARGALSPVGLYHTCATRYAMSASGEPRSPCIPRTESPGDYSSPTPPLFSNPLFTRA